jgi:hypothetical protein
MGGGSSREELEERLVGLRRENAQFRVRLARLEETSDRMIRSDAKTLSGRYTAAARENNYLRSRVAAEEFWVSGEAGKDRWKEPSADR